MRLTLFVLLAGLLPIQAGQYKGLWLKVSDEVAPAGGVVQVRVTLTEPKPIIRTRMDLEFDGSIIDEILSVSVFSENGEAAGTALRIGNIIRIEVTSPTGNLGSAERLPLVAVAARLRTDAPPGSTAVFRLRPESTFQEEEDELWEIEDNAPGVVKAGGDLSIDDLWPTGGLIRPGQTIRILGRGFQPSSQIEIEDAPFAMTTVVSATEIRVTANEPFLLDQRRISIVNSEESQTSFIPTLRGRDTAPSAYDLLAATYPLFGPVAASSASIRLPSESDAPGHFAGLALQNPGADTVTVHIDAVSCSGVLLGATTITLNRQQRIVRHLDELLPGVRRIGGATLRLESSSPIQFLGLEGNLNAGFVQPIASPSPE